MFVEMPVPQDDTSLDSHVSDQFNCSSLVGVFCEDGCQQLVQVEKSSKLTLARDSEFLTVILTRAVETLDGFTLVKNEVISTNDVFIR
jgi:hypothetical protein